MQKVIFSTKWKKILLKKKNLILVPWFLSQGVNIWCKYNKESPKRLLLHHWLQNVKFREPFFDYFQYLGHIRSLTKFTPIIFLSFFLTAAGAGWSFEDAAGCWLHSCTSPSPVPVTIQRLPNQRPNATQHAPLTISCHLMKENLATTPLAWCAVERTNSRPQKLFVLRETPFLPPPRSSGWLTPIRRTEAAFARPRWPAHSADWLGWDGNDWKRHINI